MENKYLTNYSKQMLKSVECNTILFENFSLTVKITNFQSDHLKFIQIRNTFR